MPMLNLHIFFLKKQTSYILGSRTSAFGHTIWKQKYMLHFLSEMINPLSEKYQEKKMKEMPQNLIHKVYMNRPGQISWRDTSSYQTLPH